ncbi:MAG: thiol-disulfide isomerase/thioredoxin [Cyclobacteriaceae bacterium]|jgi:thiol-disulfide isomerase/thioredoxin
MVLLEDRLIKVLELFSLEEYEFLNTLDSISNLKLKATKDYNIEDKIFLQDLRNSRQWEILSNKMWYQARHKRLLKLDTFEVSKGYYDFVRKYSINDSTQLRYSKYISYVNSVVSTETNKTFSNLENKEAETYYGTKIGTINQLISDPKIKEIFLFQIIRIAFNDFSDEDRIKIIQDWKSLNPPMANVQQYNDILTKWKSTQPGQPAPNFKYVTNKRDSLTLSDFAGKLVYIDVWATWCGPCIEEQPAMKKLQENFKDEDILFLSISIDKSPEPWIKMIEKKSLGGIHLYAPGASKATIMQDYGINGIPRFILIDKEGKIIDADASRPSGNIAETIEKHLTTQRS